MNQRPNTDKLFSLVVRSPLCISTERVSETQMPTNKELNGFPSRFRFLQHSSESLCGNIPYDRNVTKTRYHFYTDNQIITAMNNIIIFAHANTEGIQQMQHHAQFLDILQKQRGWRGRRKRRTAKPEQWNANGSPIKPVPRLPLTRLRNASRSL